ncbi:hypothetical protein ACYOEI_04910 [Singulisphaera rosea]
MAVLLKNLLFDLRQRASHIDSALRRPGTVTLPPIADNYRSRMLRTLDRVRQNIESLSSDPDLLDPMHIRNNFRDYKVLSRFVSAIEWGPLAAIRRFSEPDDVTMSLMTERICQEIGYPFDTPLCVAGSYGHYSTYADMDLILAPSSEPFHLLGLSDLYHELGHIISLRAKRRMIEPFSAVIDVHFDGEVRRATQDGRPPAFIKKLDDLRFSWNEWILEFIADIIAAYLTGPAYGWANVRLCMNIPSDVFEASSSHPADDSRATAIDLVLDTLGCDAERVRIGGMWSDFIALTGRTRPGEFDIIFPRSLLIQLRDFIVNECRILGLSPWTPVNPNPASIHITKLLSEAWVEFNRDPDNFASWEADRIRELTSEVRLKKGT